MVDSFPRQQARTRRFTLGSPRDVTVSGDGRRVAFLRAPAGDDPATALWVLDLDEGGERLVASPSDLGAGAGGDSPEERARRERRREQAAGVVGYSADRELRRAVFVVAGDLWLADLVAGGVSRLPVDGPAFDPRLDPTGTTIAWCRGGELWAAPVDDPGRGTRVAGEAGADVTWGQAEFVAAEEMHRDRGYWWSPHGTGLLVARVDVAGVGTWWVSDPAHPDRPPSALRYPAAGTADADVTLHHVGLDGSSIEIDWDRATYPYLASVSWPGTGGPLLVVERRDHHRAEVLVADPATGSTRAVARLDDGAWVDWPAGTPARLEDGRLVWTAQVGDVTGLTVDGAAVTPEGLQVRSLQHVDDGLVFTASEEPSEVGLWRWTPGGGLARLDAPGGVVVLAAASGGTVVVGRRDLTSVGARVQVTAGASEPVELATLVETPVVEPEVRIGPLGERRLRGAVLLPTGHVPGRKLPVLVYPYGGPGAQRVLADRHAWLESQWRADQGFAVVVADGRGTPGRGPAWERAVHLDLATAVLEDQVDALQAAAAANPDLDLDRVGITGWSFGGYLAALAVLRRPEVFHAAVAGAPVTDWRLYDTYYTERFLGHPDAEPEAYARSSLLADAPRLTRPLLLVHGMVDDNVVVGHTIRLSQHLTAHGRAHAVLPLTGMTHFTSEEDLAEHVLRLQNRFLVDALTR